MHLLQVCNVGHICGGTAACAWTITRALPDIRHTVAFLSRPTNSTRRAFAHCRVESWERVDESRLRPLRPDLVLLHNVAAACAGPVRSAVTIQYLHSVIDPAPADVTVACSRWLRDQYEPGRVERVLYQPVPVPRQSSLGDTRALRSSLVVGRLCTPASRKWPDELVPFYGRLAERHPAIDWEFVGCPRSLQSPLTAACRGCATFHPARWSARSHFWRWAALLYHHPTLTESFGRTAAEAMRAGCIPIVDARGGFREQVTGETGFLCGNEREFMGALDAIHDAGRRRSLSRSVSPIVEERFSLRRFAEEFRTLLLSFGKT